MPAAFDAEMVKWTKWGPACVLDPSGLIEKACDMSIIVSILLLILGIVFVVIGGIIWMGQNTALIHDHHQTNVREEDKKAFTAGIGKALMWIGTGLIVITVLYLLFKLAWLFIILFFVTVIGLGGLFLVTKKYNGRIM